MINDGLIVLSLLGLAVNLYWSNKKLDDHQATINELLKRVLTLEDEDKKNKRMIRLAGGEI